MTNLPAKLDLILASKSPRRSQLLQQAGIPFRVATIDVEEIYPDDLPVLEVAPYLAELKARGATELLTAENQIVLTADSVVILDGKIYGKPKNRAEAIEVISKLSGKKHTVVTGVCLKSLAKEVVFHGISDVYFLEISREEIEYYVDKYEPYDKAGAYAIQEWIGLCKIARIDGTYPNIMGLPTELVYAELAKF
jgi:septum formation protein